MNTIRQVLQILRENPLEATQTVFVCLITGYAMYLFMKMGN